MPATFEEIHEMALDGRVRQVKLEATGLDAKRFRQVAEWCLKNAEKLDEESAKNNP